MKRTLWAQLVGMRYMLIFVALAVLLYLSNSRLNEVASTLDNRLFDVARLEEASRLQSEMVTFLYAARQYAEGNSAIALDEVSTGLDIVWSRVVSLNSGNYAPVIDELDPTHILDTLAEALPEFDAATKALRPGVPSSYEPLDRLSLRYSVGITALSDRAYVSRRKVKTSTIDQNITGITRINEVQFEHFVTLAVFFIYILIELALSRGTNRRLRLMVQDKQRATMTDYLTGIANRRHLEDGLQAACRQGPCSMVYFDLDRFKAVNDTLGHGVGDKLLCIFADILLENKGSSDIVARFGGDEFGAVIIGSRSDARAFATRVVNAARVLPTIDGHVIDISVSAGSCHTDDVAAIGSISPQTLMRNADLALYEAKRQGKNRSYAFEPSLLIEHERRLVLERDLAGAMARGDIYVVFQPVIRLKGNKLRAAEALVRWTHPAFGVVSPHEIIRIAEATNHIRELTCHVLDRACEMRAKLSTAASHFPISVNISPRLLAEEGFAELVMETVRQWPVDPGMLVLEITEETLAKNENFIASNVNQLKRHGFALAVDDFGTGQSNFGRLSALDLHVLKFDRSLLANIETSSRDVRILQALCRLAGDIGMLTVAEGVETEAQLAIMRQIGVGYVQGYYFSHALDAIDFMIYVAENRAGTRLKTLSPPPNNLEQVA